jgi:hypothetical protein
MIGLKIATQGFGGPVFGAAIALQGFVSVYDYQMADIEIPDIHRVPPRPIIFTAQERDTIHRVPPRPIIFTAQERDTIHRVPPRLTIFPVPE